MDVSNFGNEGTFFATEPRQPQAAPNFRYSSSNQKVTKYSYEYLRSFLHLPFFVQLAYFCTYGVEYECESVPSRLCPSWRPKGLKVSFSPEPS